MRHEAAHGAVRDNGATAILELLEARVHGRLLQVFPLSVFGVALADEHDLTLLEGVIRVICHALRMLWHQVLVERMHRNDAQRLAEAHVEREHASLWFVRCTVARNLSKASLSGKEKHRHRRKGGSGAPWSTWLKLKVLLAELGLFGAWMCLMSLATQIALNTGLMSTVKSGASGSLVFHQMWRCTPSSAFSSCSAKCVGVRRAPNGQTFGRTGGDEEGSAQLP